MKYNILNGMINHRIQKRFWAEFSLYKCVLCNLIYGQQDINLYFQLKISKYLKKYQRVRKHVKVFKFYELLRNY